MKKRLRERILDFFFPPKCVFCRKLLHDDEAEVCCACRLNLPICADPARHGVYFTDFTAVFHYEGVVRDSIHRFKFDGMEQYSTCYGKLMAAAISAKLKGSFDLITWTPVSTKRRRKRGYDQSERLAGVIGAALGIPLVRTLVKTRNNPAQSSLDDAQARRANVLGVYAAPHPQAVADRRILLIDDVSTTGSTLEEASRVLLTAGAAEICCAVLAVKRKK